MSDQQTKNLDMSDGPLIFDVKKKIKEHLKEFDLTIAKLSNVTTHVHKNYFVTGGCIGSLLRNEVPKDYDVYFRDEKIAKQVIDLYTSDSYKNEIEVIEEKYRDVVKTIGEDKELCITENAITLKNGIQIITRHYGTPEEIRNTFDFVHCLPYYDAFSDKLYISANQFYLNKNKKLKKNNSKNFTAWREQKFKSRGWTWED